MCEQSSIFFEQKSWKLTQGMLIIPILSLLVLAMVFAGCAPTKHSVQITPPPISSDQLKRTMFVPTLDSPLAPHKNVIWCASFPMAWRQLGEFAKEPLLLDGVKQEAGRLNNSPDYRKEMPKNAWYVAAGSVKGGIIPTIKREMARRFQKTPTSELDTFKNADALIAYAFLTAEVQFTTSYSDKGLTFTDSQSKKSYVDSFSFGSSVSKQQAKQIEVLYYGYAKPQEKELYPAEAKFAIDLCKNTPVQLVVACVERQKTLAQCLVGLNKACGEYLKTGGERKVDVGHEDQLNVPNLNLNINHHYRELEGHNFSNPKLSSYFIADAFQSVIFKMDKAGALLVSESFIAADKSAVLRLPARRFVCDHPYLIYMKMRNEKNPFFVMWVDNDEVLQKM